MYERVSDYISHVRRAKIEGFNLTVQPASHCWIEGKVEGLDENLAILEILLADHGILLDGEGLARDDESLRALSQDDGCV